MLTTNPANKIFQQKQSAAFIFFFNDTATTEIYTLSLHDALPISRAARRQRGPDPPAARRGRAVHRHHRSGSRSEEHTSELQSPCNLVCRLLLEKKKNNHWSHVTMFIYCLFTNDPHGLIERDHDYT